MSESLHGPLSKMMEEQTSWLKPDYRWFDKYGPIGKTSMYLYRATWLAEAARDPLASEYLDFDPNDQLLQLGTIIKVLNAYV